MIDGEGQLCPSLASTLPSSLKHLRATGGGGGEVGRGSYPWRIRFLAPLFDTISAAGMLHISGDSRP